MDVRVEEFKYDKETAKSGNYPILMDENSEKLSGKFDLDKNKIIVEKGKVDLENQKEFFEYENGGIFSKTVLKEREIVIKFEKEIDEGKDAYLVADEILSYFLEKQDFNIELIYTGKEKNYLNLDDFDEGETEYEELSEKVYNVYLADTDVEVKVTKQFKVSLAFTIALRTANDIGAVDNFLRTGKVYYSNEQFSEEVLNWRSQIITGDNMLDEYRYSSGLIDNALDTSAVYNTKFLEDVYKNNKSLNVYLKDINQTIALSREDLILRKGNFGNVDDEIRDSSANEEYKKIATELKATTDANNKIFCNVLNYHLIDGVFVSDDLVKLNASSISSSSTADEIATMFQNAIKTKFDLKHRGFNVILYVFYSLNKNTNRYDYKIYTSSLNNKIVYLFRNKYI